ncbi:uncharacterized protein [Solanum lycopersicum]|uniref:uncharacterized protein isoform X4 n=1 Tax=Solanum lycopersicum TaxID=4081 RepID=UPI00374887E7
MVKIMVARTKQEGAGCQANDERQTLGHCGSCWSCCGAAESLSDCFCIHFGWCVKDERKLNAEIVDLQVQNLKVFLSYQVIEELDL